MEDLVSLAVLPVRAAGLFALFPVTPAHAQLAVLRHAPPAAIAILERAGELADRDARGCVVHDEVEAVLRNVAGHRVAAERGLRSRGIERARAALRRLIAIGLHASGARDGDAARRRES